jgi:D-beta-D-heptose 7-phosphate kinase/D-beta-D-heptose 1-phosphate adenosyltransferase
MVDGSPPADRVLSVLRRTEGLHVWVVGDVMLDEYFEGDVARISPEAPVQIVQVERVYHRLGGAANVAHGVVALGARAVLCGAIGEDAPGGVLADLCGRVGIATSALLRLGDRPTTRKARVLAQHQQILRLDWEKRAPVQEADVARALRSLDSGDPPHAVILSDYAKGFLSPGLLRGVLDRARDLGVPVVVDPKSSDFSRYAGATVITPNLRELEVAVGRSFEGVSATEIERSARDLLGSLGIRALVVTMGARGMLLVPSDGAADAIHTLARDVFDVTGAGDTVVATLAVALAARMALGDAARLANAAAGVVVGKVGTATASPVEIATALAGGRRTKVLDLDELRERVAWWRLQNKKLVFTNGCYDIVHAGHLKLLREAAAQGDVLIVAVNSDASVARLKGPDRPLIAERERAELLAALECVDAVVVFGEDTPLELIQQVLPDVLVKGADYEVAAVIGRDVVERHGGVVKLVQLVPEHSTSQLVRRIRGSEA